MSYNYYETDVMVYMWVFIGIFAAIMALVGVFLYLRRRRIILAQNGRAGIVFVQPAQPTTIYSPGMNNNYMSGPHLVYSQAPPQYSALPPAPYAQPNQEPNPNVNRF